jgi:sortase A
MTTDDNTNPTTDKSLDNQRPVSFDPKNLQQKAAENVILGQINNLFDSPGATQANTQPTEEVNPYERTHSNESRPIEEQWKQYHSAWQTYYQKYYEGYYTHHLGKALASQPEAKSNNYFSESQTLPEAPESVTKDEALYDLRQKLLANVSESAKKVRKSRHFIPITSAVLVVLLFTFLQYNRLIVSNVLAYVSPGNIDPQNIVIDPSTDITVSSDPRLIIPKINVDVPVLYSVGSDYDSQMAAMQNGVAHFAIPGASSLPGEVGNTVLSGHSSNDLLDKGDYKFIFAQLDKLQTGDSIYINYNSKRYTYTVTKKEVVEPTDVNKLVYTGSKPILTLITCTPLGTSLHRLLVTAEQVSPDPASAASAPSDSNTKATNEIPGVTPTFLEKLFGSNGSSN